MRTTMSLREVLLLNWLWMFWENPGWGPFSSQRKRNEDSAKSSEYSEFSQAQVRCRVCDWFTLFRWVRWWRWNHSSHKHSQWHQWLRQDHKCKHLLKVSLVSENYEKSRRVDVLINGLYIKANVYHRFSFIVFILRKTNKIPCIFKALLQCELSGVQ